MSNEHLTKQDQAIRVAVATRIIGKRPGVFTWTVLDPLILAEHVDDAITTPAAVWAQGWRYVACYAGFPQEG